VEQLSSTDVVTEEPKATEAPIPRQDIVGAWTKLESSYQDTLLSYSFLRDVKAGTPRSQRDKSPVAFNGLPVQLIRLPSEEGLVVGSNDAPVAMAVQRVVKDSDLPYHRHTGSKDY
jgi:hypothetical protein